jgi:hypothetical protein
VAADNQAIEVFYQLQNTWGQLNDFKKYICAVKVGETIVFFLLETWIIYANVYLCTFESKLLLYDWGDAPNTKQKAIHM